MPGPLRQFQPATSTNTMSQPTSTAYRSMESIPGASMQSGTQTPQPPSLGMTPASRYDHNLRVMRRRDPSILSIIDQFSHVCVYYHDGHTWLKHGVEGSMFLFEKGSYPPYGFYIMNRAGRSDYVQLLYPEDEVVPTQKFLIIRSYPEFLRARLTRLTSLYPGQDLDKFSDVYAVPNVDEIDSKSKGHPTCIALWTMEDNSRDSLIEVLQRLSSYIKKNEPYPQEFCYGPGRPPPPNRLRAIPKKTAGSTSDSQAQRVESDSENERSYHSDAPNSTNHGGFSDVDRLFSRLGPPLSPQGAKSIAQSDAPKPVSSSLTLRGKALLDTIFASATANASTSANAINRENPTVFSPQPSIGTPSPHVLNSQVLTSMLTGEVPSRASSVVSHPSSREGDNEGGSRSESPSTVLDEESDHLSYRSTRRRAPRISSELRNGNPVRLGQKVNGDVTPRLPTNGLLRTSSATDTSSTTRLTNHTNPPAPFSVRDASFKPIKRDSTPFETESDLSPSQHSTTSTGEDDASDIIELNFEDTSLLSDPDFTKVVKQRKSAVMLRQTDGITGSTRLNGNASSFVPTEKVKAKNRRKTRKEDTEKSRDLRPISPGATLGMGVEKILDNGHPSNFSSVSVHRKSLSATGLEIKTPTMPNTTGLPRNKTFSSSKSKGKMVNGHTETLNGDGPASTVDPEAVKSSLTQVLDGQDHPLPTASKSEFLRQVLELLQTDESFGERLYMDYMTAA